MEWLLFAEEYHLPRLAARAEFFLAEQGKQLAKIPEASNISSSSLLRILDTRYRNCLCKGTKRREGSLHGCA